MKKELYRFPIVEAFSDDNECPFCFLYERSEQEVLNTLLGTANAYMEDYIRERTDKEGFCKNHLKIMKNMDNKLGVAIMLETHTKRKNSELEALINNCGEVKKKSFFNKGKKNDGDDGLQKLVSYLNDFENDCYLCNKVDEQFIKYIDNYLHLYKNDAEIKTLTDNSKGFCLPHFKQLIITAEKILKQKESEEFLNVVFKLETENLKRIEEDISWFVCKSDYRYKSEPWKNSKDAIKRTMKKLASLEEE